MDFLSEKLQGISSAYASRSHTNPFHNLFSSSPTTQDPLLSALGLDSSPSLILILDPPLPPFLQPLPSIFRALSVIVLLPIFLICVVDFAGYAVFRTLGESSISLEQVPIHGRLEGRKTRFEQRPERRASQLATPRVWLE